MSNDDDWEIGIDDLDSESDAGLGRGILQFFGILIGIVVVLSPLIPIGAYFFGVIGFETTVLTYLVYMTLLSFWTFQTAVNA